MQISNNFYSKQCTKCRESKEISDFVKGTNLCKECKKREYSKNKLIIYKGLGKECTQCLNFKKWDEFYYSKNSYDKKSIYCKSCSDANNRLSRLTNINLRLSHSLRTRINTVLKGNKKSASTEELTGCSIIELRTHFEKLFTIGMNWENHGTGKNGKGKKEWHIDHIMPCSNFDLSKPEEQRKCFHFSNLQPLWAIDNLIKSNNLKYILK